MLASVFGMTASRRRQEVAAREAAAVTIRGRPPRILWLSLGSSQAAGQTARERVLEVGTGGESVSAEVVAKAARLVSLGTVDKTGPARHDRTAAVLIEKLARTI